jgi:peptide/nickel transport system substrate-binding protein
MPSYTRLRPRPALRAPALIAVLIVLGGCVGRDEPAVDELVFALGAWPTNIDPRYAPDAYSDRIARLVYAPLLKRTATGEVQPLLAETFERPEPQTVIVRLKPEAVFHDGTPVQASDVVATFDSIRGPDSQSVKRLFLDSIDTVTASDPVTVVFHLRSPHAPFLQVLAGIGIVPAAAIRTGNADALGSWTGSGPYLFDGISPGEEIRLRRNGDWVGPSARIDRLRFRAVPDATVRVLELIHGSVDMTWNDLPPHVVAWLETRDGLQVERRESNLVKYLAFNLDHEALGDVRVRRAIALAIDVDTIVRFKLRGQATPARSFMHPDSWSYADELPLPRYAPDEARALLDEAGYPDPGDGTPRLKLSYRTSQDETAVAVAWVLRRQLAEIGVEMEVRSNEWGVFFGDIKQGRFDLYTLTGVGIDDPDWYSFVLHSKSLPPDGANRMRYVNPAMDALLDAGRVELDPGRRAAIYAEVQRLRARDLPLLPLWYQHNVAVAGSNVVGWTVPTSGDYAALVAARKIGKR